MCLLRCCPLLCTEQVSLNKCLFQHDLLNAVPVSIPMLVAHEEYTVVLYDGEVIK